MNIHDGYGYRTHKVTVGAYKSTCTYKVLNVVFDL